METTHQDKTSQEKKYQDKNVFARNVSATKRFSDKRYLSKSISVRNRSAVKNKLVGKCFCGHNLSAQKDRTYHQETLCITLKCTYSQNISAYRQTILIRREL
jgi:hypothetical protein